MSSFVISRTPYRISFFGGGTDYPSWYRENPGAVLATSIDKYCYLMCRWLPPFFEHKHYIAYSEIERPQEVNEIRHPTVREVLKLIKITDGVGIHHAGDLPARTGMGTSSSFTVGLLHAFCALREVIVSKMELAFDAIHVEQHMVGENVGSQDQVMASFGGFNRVDFQGERIISKGEVVPELQVTPIQSPRLKDLESCLLLCFTGFSRTASQIAKDWIYRTKVNRPILAQMYAMVDEGVKILTGKGSLSDFGKLLDESWRLKQSLSSKVSTDYIDYLYSNATNAGAVGGKLLGAGGGGFLLLFVEPDLQAKVRERLNNLLQVPFRFESNGSKIIFNE